MDIKEIKENKELYIFSNILDVYPLIYDLPIVNLDSQVSPDIFDIISQKKYFTTVAMYDNTHQLILTPKHKLPKGEFSGANIQESINSIAQETLPKVKLGEIEPIALIEHRFADSKGRTHSQYGLGFMGRIRNKEEALTNIGQNILVGIKNNETDSVDYLQSKDVLSYCIRRLDAMQKKEIQNEEIDTNEQTRMRYIIHKEIVKKFILTNKRKRKGEFTKLIAGLAKGCKSILDASCGDSGLLLDIAKENEKDIDFAVGNDISWSQISLIKNNNPKISFTNHDLTNLPFRENAFGVALCCNTLHHMPSEEHLVDLFKNLTRVAEKVVIVEIESPEKTGGFPKFLNKYYYEGFLRDVGEHYLTQQEFKDKIDTNCKDNADINYSNFKNIQGNYMIAEIKKKRSK